MTTTYIIIIIYLEFLHLGDGRSTLEERRVATAATLLDVDASGFQDSPRVVVGQLHHGLLGVALHLLVFHELLQFLRVLRADYTQERSRSLLRHEHT